MKAIKDYPIHKTNPFLVGMFIQESTKIVKIQDTDFHITDSQGNNKGKVVYAKEHNIDRTPFIKLFEFDFLLHVDRAGIVVFVFICKHGIRYGNDQVVIIIDEVLSHTEYNTASPIYKGIAALIEHNVLARTASNQIYFINPAVAYKGERWYLGK